MRIKKKEKKDLGRERKKIKKRAEITKQRLKIDPTYVDSKIQSEEGGISLHEVNQISTSITKVNCSLEKLIEKYKMSDLKSLNNLTTEVKEDIKKDINSHTEMLSTAKNIVKKVETVNEFLTHMAKGGNSEVEENQNFQDIIYYPTQSGNSGSDSPNKATSKSSIIPFSQPKRFKRLKCKKIFVLYSKNDENDMKKKLIKCHNADEVFINKHYRKYRCVIFQGKKSR